MAEFTIDVDFDLYVMQQLESLGLKQHSDYHIESEMDPRLKEALSGGAKTEQHSHFGKPDLNITRYNTPVLFENKLKPTKFAKFNNKGEVTTSAKDIKDYALNGALHYARTILSSKLYDSCVIVATAGQDPDHMKQKVYYVYSVNGEPKYINGYDTLKFLGNNVAFDAYIKDVTLTDTEKHQILVKTQQDLSKQVKKLNKLMENFQISVTDRVIYVSGMILAMQNVRRHDDDQSVGEPGLTPKELHGYQGTRRDSYLVTGQIENFLRGRENIPEDKIKLMMSIFRNVIQIDADRDVLIDKDKLVAKDIKEDQASMTKQVFVFLYKHMFRQISDTVGSLDILGLAYSSLLKYSTNANSGSLGIVLTPSYVTDLMASLVKLNYKSHVMDLATGSGSFLVSAMNQMIADANEHSVINSDDVKQKIDHIRRYQLLGVELNARMWVLAAVNMVLRNDGSSSLIKGSSFDLADSVFDKFKPDRFLLNPPFSYKENGMPFVELGLKHMQPHGLVAVIIQDSAGSGKAKLTNQAILKHNTLLASIKMPTDLFEPSAGVQTSIYLFEAGVPHDFDRPVNFVDFRNDGYKRTKRGLNEVDHPIERYEDVVNIARYGRHAKLKHPELWDLDKQVFEEPIDDSGADWNFESHQVFDTIPCEEDFFKTVGDYLDFEISNVLKEML